MKWEYSIRSFATKNFDDWKHHMNMDGEEGWEVIQIIRVLWRAYIKSGLAPLTGARPRGAPPSYRPEAAEKHALGLLKPAKLGREPENEGSRADLPAPDSLPPMAESNPHSMGLLA